MPTFRNKKFVKRNSDCTNIVFCQGKQKPDGDWVECSDTEIETRKCIQLYIIDDVRYFGYL